MCGVPLRSPKHQREMQRAMAVERGILAEKKGNHSENGGVKASRKREREGKSAKESEAEVEVAVAVAVEEEEVEEFFAILKRIHSSMKHIEKLEGGGSGCKSIEEMMRSRPSLPAITEEKKVDFDLNEDPALELDSY